MALSSAPVAMTVDVQPPLLMAAEVSAPEPKRGAKRARKETVDAAAVGAMAATAVTPGPKRGKAKAEAAPAPPAEGSVPEDLEKTGEPGSWLIVAKTVRGLLKSNPSAAMHCGSDALPALNAKVVELIQEAIARAVANNRKTLKSCDF
jgi:hypothetical protein